MLRRLGQLLLLSVATLAGCNFDAVPIGASTDGDAGSRPLTEDERLAIFGRDLAGTWRGLATFQTFVFDAQVIYFLLEWMPDADSPRSGELSIRCVPGAANCTPVGPGIIEFHYSLYEMPEQGHVKGAAELLDDNGMVTALGTLDLKLYGSELSFFASGPPPFIFASMFGMSFTKDPPPPLVPDAGPSFVGPSP